MGLDQRVDKIKALALSLYIFIFVIGGSAFDVLWGELFFLCPDTFKKVRVYD